MTEYEQRILFGSLEALKKSIDRLADAVLGKYADMPANKATTDSERYREYKDNGGVLKWNEWHRKDKAGEKIDR